VKLTDRFDQFITWLASTCRGPINTPDPILLPLTTRPTQRQG
jgi:hypothetical protein